LCIYFQAGRGVGFLNDERRVNVALTRAKCSLWVVGNGEVLKSSELWQTLLQQMNQRGALRRADEFKDIFSQWKASNEAG
jgi:senataxin